MGVTSRTESSRVKVSATASGNDGAAGGEKERGRIGRSNDDIGAQAFLAVGVVFNHAVGDAHHQQNQHDFEADGQNADASPDRAV